MCAWSQLGLRDKADAPRKVGTERARAVHGDNKAGKGSRRQCGSERTNTMADLTFERPPLSPIPAHVPQLSVCVQVCVLARALKNGSIITKSHVRPQLSRTVHILINFSPNYYIIWFLFSS